MPFWNSLEFIGIHWKSFEKLPKHYLVLSMFYGGQIAFRVMEIYFKHPQSLSENPATNPSSVWSIFDES